MDLIHASPRPLTSPHHTSPRHLTSPPHLTSPEQDPGVDLVPHRRGQLVHRLLEREHPLGCIVLEGVKLLHLVSHPVQVCGAPGEV